MQARHWAHEHRYRNATHVRERGAIEIVQRAWLLPWAHRFRFRCRKHSSSVATFLVLSCFRLVGRCRLPRPPCVAQHALLRKKHWLKDSASWIKFGLDPRGDMGLQEVQVLCVSLWVRAGIQRQLGNPRPAALQPQQNPHTPPRRKFHLPGLSTKYSSESPPLVPPITIQPSSLQPISTETSPF